MKIKKPLAYIAAVTLSVTTLLILQSPKASAATITWDGVGGVAGSMKDDANWVGNSAPVSNDTVVFPAGAILVNVDFDIPGLDLTEIIFGAAPSDDYAYTLNGVIKTDKVTTHGIGIATIPDNYVLDRSLTFDANDSSQIFINGIVSGSGGPIIKSGSGTLGLFGANTYSTDTTLNDGLLYVTNPLGLGTSAGVTTVANGSSLVMDVVGDGITIAEPLTLNGSGISGAGALGVFHSTGNASSVTWSAPVTLGSSSKINSDRPLVFSGAFNSTGGITFIDDSTEKTGSLSLTGTVSGTGANVVSALYVVNNNQSNSSLTVNSGGILKGTGTVGVLSVLSGGRVAPGLSPGCLAAGNTTIAGSFDVEIGGTTACTQHDQLQVTGTVNLSGGTLNVSRWNGFNPTAGQTFTIITNDLADSTGTFAGLSQGATVTVDGFTFTISYSGGDGNDVVLTSTGGSAATPTPGTPNTGFKLVMSNPLATLLASMISAGILILIAKRFKVTATKIK